jgi:phosphatidylserine/phosphatidylglycerophosphate/cardiolipin synthase-like enzyme
MEESKTFDSNTIWAQQGSYQPRKGNELQILIDGQAAYQEIADAFKKAKKFIYMTISFGDKDFLLVPESEEIFFNILRFRSIEGVDVRMVIWQPADLNTEDTIPDPAPGNIPGINNGPGSIQARWDKAPGINGRNTSPNSIYQDVDLTPKMGCHHQKTYIMDDGDGGYVAFVGGINPVQSYWDTPAHDSLDSRRVEWKADPIKGEKGLEKNPPLHDIFYRIKGPAVADVLSNFVERYNGANIPYTGLTSDAEELVTWNQILEVADGIEVQVLRTIAPNTYPALPRGDQGIREFYLKALKNAGAGSLVYIENQYFFDHGIISEIHEAAERGARIIALLTWRPDEGLLTGKVEKVLENIAHYKEMFPLVAGHLNVVLLTLGNCRPDPRSQREFILSETYIHSKTMAVITPDWAVITGGSANIAFTSMWFHSEMNIAFVDTNLIKNWVAQLWSEHLEISVVDAMWYLERPDDAFTFFRLQAENNLKALNNKQVPEGRVYDWKNTTFPPRDLTSINLGEVKVGEGCRQG